MSPETTRRYSWAVIALAALVFSEDAVAQKAVTDCFNFSETSQSYYLTGDLDCGSSTAITVIGNAQVKLRGFKLTGDIVVGSTGCPLTNTCNGTLRVIGPGTLDGQADASKNLRLKRVDFVRTSGMVGFAATADRHLTARNVTIDGFGAGMLAVERLRAKNVIISNTGTAIDARGSLRLTDATLTANDRAVVQTGAGDQAKLKRAHILDTTTSAVEVAGPLRVTNSVIGRSGESGIIGGGGHPVRLTRAVVAENAGSGLEVVSNSVTLRRAAVQSNGRFGVSVDGDLGAITEPSLRLVGSAIVEQNALDPQCGSTLECADLSSRDLPDVSGRAGCGTSHVFGSGVPGTSWGVCAQD